MNEALRRGWSYRKLDELGFIGRGKSKHRPRDDPSLYGGKYPFIQTGEVKAVNLYISQYSQTYNEKGLSQSKLWKPETLLITIAANIAETAILKIEACFPDSIVGFVADPKKADVRFVKYCMDTMKLRMQNVSKGTTQDNLSLDKLLTFDFLMPPLPTQRKIAAILSAYDDLIENNTRRIRILEEMAQALYREWFVKFRFPGHEKMKMVESELGMVPEGWEVVTIRDVSNYINRGVSPKYDDQSSQIVINQKCIRDGKFNPDLVRRHVSKIPVEKSIKFGDVLINSTGIGTLGRIAQIYMEIPNCTVDSHVTIVRPNDKVSIDYFGSYLSTLESHFDSQGIGSTGQTELGRETIAKTSFMLPLRCIQDRFSEIISPMSKSIVKMFAKNVNLRRTRDLLLPKLISGEVDVEKIEIRMLENGGA